MKREIKFRGKRIDNGEWVYGSYTQMREDDHNECFRAKPHKTYHRIWQWEAGDWNMGGYANYEVIPETVGQFTGLKDKNGVEIYEGDIVVCLHAGQSIRGAIINKDACYFIKFTNGQMAWIGEAVKKYKVEVLGNIHDNPELLND